MLHACFLIAAFGARRPRNRPRISFVPVRADRVAGELAAHRVALDRVAGVERDVRLVRPELLAVVRHVAAAVEVDRREHRVAEEPAADEVVDLPVAEQQPVRGLVHEDVVAADHRAHREEREHPDDRVVRPHRERDHADGHRVRADDGERVAPRRDAPELLAPLGHRLRDRGDPAVGPRRDEQLRGPGPSSACSSGSVVATHRCYGDYNRCSNHVTSRVATAPEPLLDRPLSARSVMASLLLGRRPARGPGGGPRAVVRALRHRRGNGSGRAPPHGGQG